MQETKVHGCERVWCLAEEEFGAVVGGALTWREIGL